MMPVCPVDAASIVIEESVAAKTCPGLNTPKDNASEAETHSDAVNFLRDTIIAFPRLTY